MNKEQLEGDGQVIDVEATARTRVLWNKFGYRGEEKVCKFVTQANLFEARVYMHGGGARYAEGLGVYKSMWVDDVDLVLTGVDGRQIEEIAKDVLTGCHIKARVQVDSGVIKTVEVDRDRARVAELVFARGGDKEPSTEATIEDHLGGCWTPDGRVVAYELKEREGQMFLSKIEVQKEVELDYEKVRPDHVWWWFRALVRGEINEDLRENVEAMIAKFVENRQSELANWRLDGESRNDWLTKSRDRGRVIPLQDSLRPRVRELGIRTYEGYHAEGIFSKLNDCIQQDGMTCWEIGMRTGLLPAVFPVLGYIPNYIGDEIVSRLKKVEGNKTVKKWMAIFKPIFNDIYNLARESKTYDSEKGYKRYSWTRAMGLVSDRLPETVRGEALRVPINNRRTVGEQTEINWRARALWPFILWHEDRLGSVVKSQIRGNAVRKSTRTRCDSDFEFTDEVARLTLGNGHRYCRDLAQLIDSHPVELFRSLMSFLPTGKMFNRETLKEELLS